MAKSDYRPGRRRKPIVSLLLDWAAGVLIGILLVMLGAGVVAVAVAPGLERLGALVMMSFIAWPIGAALGVWLCVGRPLTARGFGYGLGVTLAGVGVLMLPFWLDVESDVLRGIGGIAALICAPGFARVGVALARRREHALE
ncbi:hypothetical protein [Enhygromyxa salina]|uniref:hypothetical protein n=1 Tax=Enhygromyxa salina TaxID=215803 RepID=UPI000D087352|nr:hypothetical protein [Enhygromyxa salina]